LPERPGNPSPTENPSWLASAIVIIAAAFLLLTLREGQPEPYQRVIDSIMHNWMAMVPIALVLWSIRRRRLGSVPGILNAIAGVALLVAVLYSAMGLLTWGPLWSVLQRFGVPQDEVLPLAAFGLIGLWFLGLMVFVLRGFFRWMGKRFEQHGVAIGLGPVYFYFRRRKVS
jgi:hypothetical protein